MIWEVWGRGDVDVVVVAEGYFRNMFRSNMPNTTNLEKVTQYILVFITENHSIILDAPFSTSEAKHALFDIGSLKAPN